MDGLIYLIKNNPIINYKKKQKGHEIYFKKYKPKSSFYGNVPFFKDMNGAVQILNTWKITNYNYNNKLLKEQ